MSKPKYSIIIPTKNRGYCVWKSILSVQKQSFTNWELLVVDGNSTDNTKKVVDEFADDQRIRFITNVNDTGVASARNKGIVEAQGELIAYLDSDDFVYENWLETIDEVVKLQDTVIVMPNKRFIMKLVDENNKTVQTFIDKDLYDNPPTVRGIANLEVPSDTNGMVHSKSIVEKVGNWSTNLKLYEDFEFLLRVLEFFSDKFEYIPQRLVEYTRTYGKDGLCGKAKYSDLVDCLERVYEKHKDSSILKEITWYPSTIEKYRRYSQEENTTGKTILDHLLEKYNNGKN